jgi:hypothetical protein
MMSDARNERTTRVPIVNQEGSPFAGREDTVARSRDEETKKLTTTTTGAGREGGRRGEEIEGDA